MPSNICLHLLEIFSNLGGVGRSSLGYSSLVSCSRSWAAPSASLFHTPNTNPHSVYLSNLEFSLFLAVDIPHRYCYLVHSLLLTQLPPHTIFPSHFLGNALIVLPPFPCSATPKHSLFFSAPFASRLPSFSILRNQRPGKRVKVARFQMSCYVPSIPSTAQRNLSFGGLSAVLRPRWSHWWGLDRLGIPRPVSIRHLDLRKKRAWTLRCPLSWYPACLGKSCDFELCYKKESIKLCHIRPESRPIFILLYRSNSIQQKNLENAAKAKPRSVCT